MRRLISLFEHSQEVSQLQISSHFRIGLTCTASEEGFGNLAH